MRAQQVLPLAVCCLLMPTAPSAGSAPVAVSPGDTSKLVLIGDACPTFSWGEVAEAKSYELVVYRVGHESEAAKTVLRQRVAGTANVWTPSLDRCLERGRRYAWIVRALDDESAPVWSAPSLFQVAAGPTAAEFEQAVQIVRSYLHSRGEGIDSRADSAEPPTSAPLQADEGAAEVPEPRAPTAALAVEGGVQADAFWGDGSGLTGVGDVTGVAAGNGLLGGGDSGDLSVAVGAGPGIQVTADTITVDFAGTGSTQEVARSDHHHATAYVDQSGDTMTGELNVATSLPRIDLNTSGDAAEYRIQKNGSARWSLGWNEGSSYLYFYDWFSPHGTRLVIDDTTGNVGIGTTSPDAKLDVADLVRVRGNSPPPGAREAVSSWPTIRVTTRGRSESSTGAPRSSASFI